MARLYEKNLYRRKTIRHIRRIKKSIKKGRHGYLSCYGRRGISAAFEFSSLEVAARFLRIKGYSVELRIYYIPFFRHVFISY